MLHRPDRIASASVGVLLVATLSLLDDVQPGALQASGDMQNGVDVERLVARFLATTDEYEKTFQNLVAEERRPSKSSSAPAKWTSAGRSSLISSCIGHQAMRAR